MGRRATFARRALSLYLPKLLKCTLRVQTDDRRTNAHNSLLDARRGGAPARPDARRQPRSRPGAALARRPVLRHHDSCAGSAGGQRRCHGGRNRSCDRGRGTPHRAGCGVGAPRSDDLRPDGVRGRGERADAGRWHRAGGAAALSKCPSSAPAPPQDTLGGSGRFCTPRERPTHWAPSHSLVCPS
eukprot:scaffold9313_cov55-Phaeocystis_antarctica.AAC.3